VGNQAVARDRLNSHVSRVEVMNNYRVGLVVPSSNTTMETEIPGLLRRCGNGLGDRFTFHSSRMRMKHVSAAELKAMDAQSLRCAAELADARVDVLAYACLVAIMAQGSGYHRESAEAIGKEVADVAGTAVPIVTSAGALVDALRHLKATRISVITPYMKPLTKMVCEYLAAEGFHIHDALSLEVADNLAVGRLPQDQLVQLADKVDTKGVDALILSACVQMPSMGAVPRVQSRFGIPVLSAATATVWQLLGCLSLPQVVPGAGLLLELPIKQITQPAQSARTN
jgi:maleate isomerase